MRLSHLVETNETAGRTHGADELPRNSASLKVGIESQLNREPTIDKNRLGADVPDSRTSFPGCA